MKNEAGIVMKLDESLKKQESIKRTLIRMIALLIIIPIIILGTYAYTVARRNLIQQTKIAMQGNVDVISHGIESNVKRENDVVKFFSYEDSFRRALEKVRSDPYTLTEELNEEIEPLIWYYLSSDTNIESITIYSHILEAEHIGDFLIKPKTPREQEWYDYTSGEYGSFWATDDRDGVYLIKALLDSATSSKRIGMIVLKVKTEAFFSIAHQSRYLDNGLIILDDDNNVINHRKIEDAALDERIIESIMSGETREFVDDPAYFICPSEHTSNNWTLYYYIDRNEITADVFRILGSVVVIAAVLLLAALVAGTIFSNNLSGRIRAINDMAYEIKNGRFDVVNNDSNNDEIGQLSAAIKDIAATISRMMAEIDKMNKEQLMLKENDIHYREWLFDFVVERNDGAILGIEVKAGQASLDDFKALKWFAKNLAKKTFTGIVLYSGSQTLRFGEGFYAVPFSALG